MCKRVAQHAQTRTIPALVVVVMASTMAPASMAQLLEHTSVARPSAKNMGQPRPGKHMRNMYRKKGALISASVSRSLCLTQNHLNVKLSLYCTRIAVRLTDYIFLYSGGAGARCIHECHLGGIRSCVRVPATGARLQSGHPKTPLSAV